MSLYFKNQEIVVLSLFVFTFFSKIFFNIEIMNIQIDIFMIFFFLFYFIFIINWNDKNIKKVIYFLISFIVFQISLKMINDYSIFGLVKQIAPIIIIYISTYFIITKYGINKIFLYYEKFILILCVFGLIQIFLNFFEISFFQKELWRMNSLMAEPSHFGIMILPVFIKNLLANKKISLELSIYLISLFFTFSISVIISAILSLLLFFYSRIINQKKISLQKTLLFISLFILIVVISFVLSDKLFQAGTMFSIVNYDFFITNKNLILEIKELLNYLYNFLYNYELYRLEFLTFHSLITNFKIAISTLIQFPFGVGLGGNEEAFFSFKEMYVNYNFLPGYEYETLKYYYFGSKSSQSLLLRMIIEFGFIFLFSLFFLIFKIFNLLKTYEKKKIVYLISVISFLLCKFLKLGSYIDYGTNFFIITLLILCFKKDEFLSNSKK